MFAHNVLCDACPNNARTMSAFIEFNRRGFVQYGRPRATYIVHVYTMSYLTCSLVSPHNILYSISLCQSSENFAKKLIVYRTFNCLGDNTVPFVQVLCFFSRYIHILYHHIILQRGKDGGSKVHLHTPVLCQFTLTSHVGYVITVKRAQCTVVVYS